MEGKRLAVYLNDHLAGSVSALELFGFLERSEWPAGGQAILAELRAEVAADRAVLESLMARLRIPESGFRKAAAWTGGKLSELKFRLEDSTGDLHRLEALDALSMGIEGKSLLWRALGVAAETDPELQGPSYVALAERAQMQRTRLEEIRLTAARVAFQAGIGE